MSISAPRSFDSASEYSVRLGIGTPLRSASSLSASEKRETVDLHHELDRVAAHAAAEALVELARLVDAEGWRFLLMERTQPHVPPRGADALEAHVFADHLDDVDGRLELFDEVHTYLRGEDCLPNYATSP